VSGQDLWTATMGLLHNLGLSGGIFGVAAFSIHALNGLRLIFQELGFSRENGPPISLQRCNRKKRTLTIVMIVLIILVIGVFFYDFNAGGW
jgi:succinate dehydrogenase/fumarate reductase cytochrome b subunit